eukprot:TRINITY_DN3097_c0_g2_i1.p1 TRINITY_DN3097_c0_g2~~TRINITY_DN3097_c0_g2_i1.p1  ORF type:complete len:128 (+),score=29.81 TRINITY_DN3097_c0_g2_i1:911-1294(+)
MRQNGTDDEEVICKKQLELVGPLFLGLAEKKAMDTLLTRWRMTKGLMASTWKDPARARELLDTTRNKILMSCPIELIRNRWNEVTHLHMFFHQHVASRKLEILLLMKQKCEECGILLTEEETNHYFS